MRELPVLVASVDFQYRGIGEFAQIIFFSDFGSSRVPKLQKSVVESIVLSL